MTYREMAGELPWRERAELDKLLAMVRPGQRQKAEKAAENLAKARRKRRLNAASDKQRRVLVGARVPREEALAIELAAKERGVSTYRFVRDALLAAAGCAPPLSPGAGCPPRGHPATWPPARSAGVPPAAWGKAARTSGFPCGGEDTTAAAAAHAAAVFLNHNHRTNSIG